MSIILALLTLSFLIFFHELGHFLVARWCGVGVEVFSIGFGKKVIAKTYRGTQYAISLIPFGGYVKLKSNTKANVLSQDCLEAKHPLQKIAILLAGPMFNFFLAFWLFCMVGKIGLNQLLPVVGEVQRDMPAALAGLQPGDKIISINNKTIVSWRELYDLIGSVGYKEVHISFLRGDSKMQVVITPKVLEKKDIFSQKRAFIGIGARGDSALVKYDLLGSIYFAWQQSLDSAKMIIHSIEKLILGVVPLSQISGAIGIVDSMAQVSKQDLVLFLLWVGLISINLGILNLLPIPALDGGQILFVLYTWISRKEVSRATSQILVFLGFSIIILLMLLGLYNDIYRLIYG